MSQNHQREEKTKVKVQSVARATGIVSIVTLASRVLGMLRDVMIASYFGAGFATDAFFTAFKIPNLLRRLVAEGSLSTAFVPVISDELEKGDAAVRHALRATSGFCLILTGSLTLLGLIFAHEITLVFAMGWTDQPEKLQLATELLRWMFPYVLLISLTALSSGTLNAMGYFGWAGAAPAILNIAFIAIIGLFSQFFDEPIFSLPVALVLGGFMGLLPMILALRKLGLTLRPLSPFGSGVVRRLVHLMLPAIFSSSVYQIMVFLNSILVTMLEEGAPSWLYFADRLFQFPLGVFSIALATAVLPSLSRLSAKDDTEGFSLLLTQTLAWVAFITIPATVGLIYLALPIVQVIYQSGAFTVIDSANTALSLIGFSIGLWPLSAHTVLVRAFLAKKNSVTPAKVACISIGANMILALALMGPPLYPDSNIGTRTLYALQSILPDVALGHVGLALAGSLASLISLGLLIAMMHKIAVQLQWRMLLISIAKTLSASLVMLLALHYALAQTSEIRNPILALCLCIGAGLVSYFLAAVAVRSAELSSSRELLRNRRARKTRHS